MRRILAISSLVLAWLCANGALWDAMQVFAWGKMFAGYAGTMTISAALKETFDPAKRCHLCVSVAKAKDAAQKQLPAAPERGAAKFDLALHTADRPVFANDPGCWLEPPRRVAVTRVEPVPLPPPRV